ncbi:MAG: hypothetical protein FWC03_05580 [Treponema sp.]|nr:hypothetical protein [Treponema sp.]
MSANEKIGYQYTARNVILSILAGIVFISGAVLAFVFLFIPQRMAFRGSQYPPTVPEIAVSIFGVIGIVMIIAAVAGAIKSHLMKSTNDGTGTYLKHTKHRGFEGKNSRYKGKNDYWYVYYSYTDENDIYREGKYFIDNIEDVLALKHIGSFPIKFSGKKSEIAADREFLNQYKQQINEAGNADTDEITEEDKLKINIENYISSRWYLRLLLKILGPVLNGFIGRRIK